MSEQVTKVEVGCFGMGGDVARFFDNLARSVEEGDLEWFSNQFRYPLPLYCKNKICIQKSADELLSNLAAFKVRLDTMGAAELCSETVHSKLSGTSRIAVDRKAVFMDSSGGALGTLRSRFFLKNPYGHIYIEAWELMEDEDQQPVTDAFKEAFSSGKSPA